MLRKINKWCRNIYVAVPLASTFLLVSCQKETLGPTAVLTPEGKEIVNNLRVASNQFSAEALFKGIFFAEGEVGNILPEMREFKIENFLTDQTQIDEAKELHATAITELEQQHPGFLQQFKANIQSGNHVLIKSTLEDAALKLKNIFDAMYADLYAQNAETQSSLYNFLQDELESSAVGQQNLSTPQPLSKFIKDYSQDHNFSSLQRVGTAKAACLAVAWAVALAVAVWAVIVVIEGFWFASNPAYFVSGGHANVGNSLIKDKLINSIAVKLNT